MNFLPESIRLPRKLHVARQLATQKCVAMQLGAWPIPASGRRNQGEILAEEKECHKFWPSLDL